MIIDVVNAVTGEGIMRYTAEVVPREGETISKVREGKVWKVVNADYLIRPVSETASGTGDDYLELVTLTVREI